MDKEKKKKLVSFIAMKFAWLFILLLCKWARVGYRNLHFYYQAKNNPKPFIICTWHGRMLIPIYMMRNRKIIAMVSEHEDGEMIAQTILRLGYETVRGSSTRGGSKAFREMLRGIRKGANCAILPDGPNGPKQEFKLGAVLLAQRANAQILPLTFSAQKPITLKTWDAFTIWKPFSKCYGVFGEPIEIPRDIPSDELESWRLKIETQMNDLVIEADEIFRN
jgi:lysophospholipid acyltransferase (LPLAT)-like uncharacterized protein